MTTKERRSERTFRVTLLYQSWADADGESTETAIIDLMADLLHLSDEYGDAEENHRIAWHHYIAEKAEEDAQ